VILEKLLFTYRREVNMYLTETSLPEAWILCLSLSRFGGAMNTMYGLTSDDRKIFNA